MQPTDTTIPPPHPEETGAKAARAGAGGGRRVRLLSGLASLALLAALVAGTAVGTAGEDVQIQIELCPDGTARPEGGRCQTQSQTVTPAPRPTPSASSPERHDYNLKTGRGTVRGAEGEEQKTSVDVEVAPEPEHGEDEDDHDIPEPDDDPGLADVSADGGSPFSGFGADLVSGDEALRQFDIPPYLIPMYVSAGRAYGIPWNVLAAINRHETNFGRIRLQVSYAGALGWMQFMPSTWRAYGVDASGDGVADPFNPVDAIYAAARYLRACGGAEDLRRAVYCYNHADWYVDMVLKTAAIYDSLPDGLVVETGSLAFGRFPVRGKVRYGDDFRRAVASGRKPEGLRMRAEGERRATAVATQNVEVAEVQLDRKLARAFRKGSSKLDRYGLSRPSGPRAAGSAGVALARALAVAQPALDPIAPVAGALARELSPALAAGAAELVPAPQLATGVLGSLLKDGVPGALGKDGLPAGYAVSKRPGIAAVVTDSLGNRYRYGGLRKLDARVRPRAKLKGGQAIGALPEKPKAMMFSVRGAGGEPVDPRLLVDGYLLQEAADFYHALKPLGGNPFVLDDSSERAGSIVRGSQRELIRRVLGDPGIEIYGCGREDVGRGIVDRRVLGALLYLRSAGLELLVTSLRCGHSYYTAGGGVSAHSYGAAVDIAAFNGQVVTGNQGPGSLTEQAIKLLMKLKGEAQPRQLISLMSLGGPSFALGDHYNHLHIGYNFEPSLGVGRSDRGLGSVTFSSGADGGGLLSRKKVSRRHERKLSRKLGRIENPEVRKERGEGALRVHSEKRGERAAAERLARENAPKLGIEPTSAGVRALDVDVPAGARGDEAYALGAVSGGDRAGWAKSQVVLLAHRGGVWRTVGAPVDASGRTVNPNLSALATVSGGRGYAAGDKGAVVQLRGPGKAPLLLKRAVKGDLGAVDARERREKGRRAPVLEGYAAGEDGALVSLRGSGATRERFGGGGGGTATIESISFARDGSVYAAGARPSGESVEAVLLRRDSGDGWRPVSTSFGVPKSRSVRLTSVAPGRDALWVAGAAFNASTESSVEVPFAARRAGGESWQSFCASPPELAAVKELGARSRSGCRRSLTVDSSETGPAGDVAVTSKGVLVATGSGLHANESESFRPVPAGTGALAPDGVPDAGMRLSVASGGSGWALASGGRMARVVPTGGSPATSSPTVARLPLAGRSGKSATVAVAPGGDRVLALAGGRAAAFAAGTWRGGAGTGLAVRELAFAGGGTPWAVAETGQLFTYRDGGWHVPGESGAERSARLALAGALGGESLAGGAGAARAEAEGGLQAVAFGEGGGEGFAAGAEGLIVRLDGDSVSRVERTGTKATLRAVATGAGKAVAAGDRGTLLERDGSSWKARGDAAALAGGEDFTAASVLPDRTLLAAAGGLVLVREPGADWKRAPLAPLGRRVLKLTGYRADGDRLRALALVADGDGRALLDGGPAGWRPVAAPSGVAVADFAYHRASRELWVAGDGGTEPVALRLAVSRAGGVAQPRPAGRPVASAAGEADDGRAAALPRRRLADTWKVKKRISARAGRRSGS